MALSRLAPQDTTGEAPVVTVDEMADKFDACLFKAKYTWLKYRKMCDESGEALNP